VPPAGTPLPSGGPAPPDASTEESELTEGAADSPLAPTAPPEAGAEETLPETAPAAAPTKPAPPRPTFKVSTFVIVFLGLLGLLMLIDTGTRNGIACALGTYSIAPSSPQCATGGGPLYYAIGFSSAHLLATMAIAGAIEMAITAFAYNYTTDWVKAAKVAKWSGAFRKVQMAAIRSGKKDKIAALKPFQERITRLSSEVTIAQFKGMAITYFMLILMYTWVGLVIASATVAQQTISLGGAALHLNRDVLSGLPIPWWFLIFSLYTVPFSLVFRRVLKHYWIQRYAREHNVRPVAPGTAAAGGPA
jgi:uncharacterized membrane protein (DUF106 family)